MNQPPTPAITPVPTTEQQLVLNRIAMQRGRLALLCAERQQRQATAGTGWAALLSTPLLYQAVYVARQHPLAVTALVAGAVAAGPKRLARWAGVLLPLLIRLRA